MLENCCLIWNDSVDILETVKFKSATDVSDIVLALAITMTHSGQENSSLMGYEEEKLIRICKYTDTNYFM